MNNDYQSRREQKQIERERATRRRKVVKFVKTGAAVLVIIVGVGGLIWYGAHRFSVPAGDVISSTGIHWHPHLAIYIHGQKQEIPSGIGLGINERSIHTHDGTGTLHIEQIGLVTKDDIKLGEFFEIWGKQFTSTCIFNYCNTATSTIHMTVNGKLSTDFGNYEMHDGDQIEIRLEERRSTPI